MSKVETQFPARPPQAALDYLASKGQKVSEHWTDVWREEHATTFTVARSAGYDILNDLQAGLMQMLQTGGTYRDFAKQMTPILQAKGWWGYAIDPQTGEVLKSYGDNGKPVELGTPRRLRTIYDANIRTARAAGQWQRIQERVALLPYLLYRLGPSVRHRDAHKRWDGFIAQANDPFWKSHMTPNGWGCKCYVRQISEKQAEKLIASGQCADYRHGSPKIEYQDWTNKKTGQVERVPVGIDPGWDTNPGEVRFGRALKVWADKQAALGVPYPDRIEVLPGGEPVAEAVRQGLKNMPPAAWMLLEAAGIRVEVADTLLAADPALANRPLPRGHKGRGWDTLDGMTSGDRIIVTYRAVGVSGELESAPFERATAVLAHEVGHIIDHQIEVWNDAAAIAAWESDALKLQVQLQAHPALLESLGYFLQPHPAGIQETVAELWGHLVSSGLTGDVYLPNAFPQLSAYLKQRLEDVALWQKH